MRNAQAILIDTLTAILVLLAFTFTAIMTIYSMPPIYSPSQMDVIDTVYSALSTLDKVGILNESIITGEFDQITESLEFTLPSYFSFNLRIYNSSLSIIYEHIKSENPPEEAVIISYIVHVSNKTFYTTMLVEVQAWKE